MNSLPVYAAQPSEQLEDVGRVLDQSRRFMEQVAADSRLMRRSSFRWF